MGGQQHMGPDIIVHDDDGAYMVELSVPVVARRRRFLRVEAADREDAEGLARILLERAQRPCRGDAIDAVLGVGLLEEPKGEA